MSDPIRAAAVLMAKRLRVFKEYSRTQVEVGEPAIWEPEDEEALRAYDDGLLAVSGLRPLGLDMEESA